MTRAVPGAPLTYHVARLLAEGPGSSRDYAVEGVTIPLDDPDLRLADPIGGRVHLSRTNRGLLVRADLTTSLAGTCSRCLREIEIPLTVRIDEEVLPSIDLVTGQPLDVAAEPDVLRLNDHHELDLARAVRDAISLAEPIAPLCEETCPGLCLVCGERLTDGPHDHPDDDGDPRLAALRGLRVDGGPETG
ncbi:MAG TPA: DUF177 domain-containing protein [Candidatus Limnocylindrales bacterium]|nr:DUF177 domain-containing protein [Candidatus Limnocylindrales bacterium]